MRLEERQVDGKELEQHLQREKTPLEEKQTGDLVGLAGDEMRSFGHQRHDQLLSVMRSILDEREVNLTALQLPQREFQALQALQVATSARSADTHQFVFAEDRRTMLEQALAVLQPDLISHDTEVIAELQTQLAELTLKVTDLREQLLNLEEAQEETGAAPQVAKKAEDAETEDKPEDAAEEKGASTLYGPERKEPKKAASTLAGPEVTQEKQPSTLSGPERKQPPAAPTTLGDADEIAAVAKKTPWWRKVTGG